MLNRNMEVQNLTLDVDSLAITLAQWMQTILSSIGIPDQWISYVTLIVLLLFVSLIVYLLQWGVRSLLIFVFRRVSKITNLSFFEYTVKNKLPHYLALVVPYSFVRGIIPIVFFDFTVLINPLVKITDIYMVFMVIWTIMSLIRSFGDTLQEKPAFHNKPMKSYFQVIQIILFIFGAVIIYAILTGHSAKAFFAAMGAASAVLLLMFKDTIMGFVGSIQISTNDMVRIGDWITMNKYGADGDVEEINLTTVKVRNFDKTITTIPTYALISDSFQNWRGMRDSGGRRFKRALNIKHSSIRFVKDDELDKFKTVSYLSQYISGKQEEYIKHNKALGAGNSLSELHITNCDLFIQYSTNYLRHHPKINKKMTLLVRQLAPTSQGLPIELYTFTDTTVWAEYEIILAEIVNHLISVVKFFDLEIFEESSGSDLFNVYIKERKQL